MATFALDASVAISWRFPGDPTEDPPYSRRVLKELISNDAIVPEIWAFEIANNTFVSYSRRKRISEQQIVEYLRNPSPASGASRLMRPRILTLRYGRTVACQFGRTTSACCGCRGHYAT